MAYTPKLPYQSSCNLRRMAWSLNKPMTKTLEIVVGEYSEQGPEKIKPKKEESLKDYKIKIIEGKMRYLIDGMAFWAKDIRRRGEEQVERCPTYPQFAKRPLIKKSPCLCWRFLTRF